MFKTRGLALIVLGIACAGLLAAAEPPSAPPSPVPTTAPSDLDEREVARLITQLGDDDFKAREAATARLLTADQSAVPALKKAQQETHDEEVRSRLGTILFALSLWDGRETVADYAKRNGIRATELALDLGDKVTMKLTIIPAGKFLMGSPETEKGHKEIQHNVTITKPFYMGVTHVTVDQFAAFVKDSGYKTDAEKDGSSFAPEISRGKIAWAQTDGCSWQNSGFAQKGDHPVVQVSWNDATAFCVWLTKKSGKTVTLPTEAQWEYACRAGTKTAYPWGDSPDDGKGWANCADQSLKKKRPNTPADTESFGWDDGFVFTSPVGSFKANAFGLYDMIGNAFQWCQDRYGDYDKGAATDPTGADIGAPRVLRGGSWYVNPGLCRSAYRNRNAPDYRNVNYGFRVAVTPDADSK